MCLPIKTETTTTASALPRPHNSKNTTAPTTLHRFTLLPPELRNIIWELSLPEPCVFDIYPASASQKTLPQQGLRFANHYSESPPALAAVCRESRSLALHHYRPLTLGRTTKYVDLSRDMLMLESCLFGRNLLRTLLFMGQIPLIRDNLRSLAFGTSYGVHTGVWHPVLGWKKLTRGNMGKFLQRLGTFPVLERLVFVVHQEMQFEVSEMPSPKQVGSMMGCCAPDGDLMRNATVYQVSSRPSPPRVLLGRGETTSSTPPVTTRRESAGCPSGPLDPAFYLMDGDGDRHLYRVPWTSEKPWLPHANDIAYYPPVVEKDDGGVDPRENEETKHIRGLVPTSDDWVRFRQVFKRDMETGLKLGLAGTATMARPCKKRKRMTEAEDVDGDEDRQLRRLKMVRKLAKSGGCPRLPAIEGASLVWRYSLPS